VRPCGDLRLSTLLPWRLRHLLLAPHRLSFFLALVSLWCASLWWVAVQWDRLSGVLNLGYALSPSLMHGAVMVFGFIPMFFSGFLFTAGPKWLGVAPPKASQLLVPLLLQAIGWMLWLAGGHVGLSVALPGLVLSFSGLLWMSVMFWRLLARSSVADAIHARMIGLACGVGCASLAGLTASIAAGADDVALAFLLTGLWGFVVAVYVVVAHRMIPFFTSSAMPKVLAWRPFGALWFMLAVVMLEVLAAWLDLLQPQGTAWGAAWLVLRGSLELGAGVGLLWLAGIWGFTQSLQNRLLAMLHIGFVWLGLAMLLGGINHWGSWAIGKEMLPLGALHAVTMGCLASLILAMVTRVSAGHSGRPLVAERWVWTMFIALQVVTMLRIVGSWPGAHASWLLVLAASGWGALMIGWGWPLANWYGMVRADGRSG
jgi:uncharacterized protein involved in response to NO